MGFTKLLLTIALADSKWDISCSAERPEASISSIPFGTCGCGEVKRGQYQFLCERYKPVRRNFWTRPLAPITPQALKVRQPSDSSEFSALTKTERKAFGSDKPMAFLI